MDSGLYFQNLPNNLPKKAAAFPFPRPFFNVFRRQTPSQSPSIGKVLKAVF